MIQEIIYFTLPLLLAGLIHHLLIIKYNLFPFFARPLDNNLYLKNNPLLGPNKTWRGLLAVPLLTGLTSFIVSYFIRIPLPLHFFTVGFLLGLGYTLMELPNSFIKRRCGLKAGEKRTGWHGALFQLLDQTDSVLGAVLMLIIIYPANVRLYLSLFIIGSALHLLIDNYLHQSGYKNQRMIKSNNQPATMGITKLSQPAEKIASVKVTTKA